MFSTKIDEFRQFIHILSSKANEINRFIDAFVMISK